MVDKNVPDIRDAALKALFGAIASRDHARVARAVVDDPSLARQPAVVGATRAEAASYFFDAIAHYAYAGDTALHMAAAAHAPTIAGDLLMRGADARARNRRGAEPLHYAADGAPGAPTWNPDAQGAVVRLLIDAGADPNAADMGGIAPLHRAVRTRCAVAVGVLLAGGADVRRRNANGSTALHLAVQNTGRGGTGFAVARHQQAQIIRLLLEHGARPSDKNANGTSVADCAMADWIRELLERA